MPTATDQPSTGDLLSAIGNAERTGHAVDTVRDAVNAAHDALVLAEGLLEAERMLTYGSDRVAPMLLAELGHVGIPTEQIEQELAGVQKHAVKVFGDFAALQLRALARHLNETSLYLDSTVADLREAIESRAKGGDDA